MKHLDTEQIIAFLSISDLSPSALSLASEVNTHILSCRECRERVLAFQTVSDELEQYVLPAEEQVLINEVYYQGRQVPAEGLGGIRSKTI